MFQLKFEGLFSAVCSDDPVDCHLCTPGDLSEYYLYSDIPGEAGYWFH